jgi:hypothetical protein
VRRIASRTYKLNIIQTHIDNNDASIKSVFLCSACAEYASRNISFPSSAKRPPVEDNDVSSVMEKLRNNTLPIDEKVKLCKALGDSLSDELARDADKVSGQYRNLDYISNFDASTWLGKRNECIVSFLLALCRVENNASDKKMASMTKAIEQFNVLSKSKYNSAVCFHLQLADLFCHR